MSFLCLYVLSVFDFTYLYVFYYACTFVLDLICLYVSMSKKTLCLHRPRPKDPPG